MSNVALKSEEVLSSPAREQRRIGFVSTRLAGSDGVSLETEKWAEILEGMGHRCFFYRG